MPSLQPITDPSPRKPPKSMVWLALLAWTGLISIVSLPDIHAIRGEGVEHATLVANAYLDKDLSVRRWLASHGGVYVRPNERTTPNPYLKVPQRDVVTTSGMALTLMNPAYATRQLMEEFAAANGIRGHLTSLKLRNPNNAPDPWERQALQRFEQGDKKVAALTNINGAETLRLIRPVYMEKSCMSCHEDMDIPVGGVRGGISVQVPMAPFREEMEDHMTLLAWTHGGIWLLGVFAIGVMSRRSRQRLTSLLRSEDTQVRNERRIAAALSLSERIEQLSEREIIQEGIEEAQLLTNSRVAYFHFINEDQRSIELVAWSHSTLENCRAVEERHYPIEQAGIWVDCARLRQPVVHNDYLHATGRRGLPEGHAPIRRHLGVPVLEGGLIRAIAGVGNKEAPYDDDDVRLLQLHAIDIWKLIQRKRSDSRLRASERLLKEAQQMARMGSWAFDPGSRHFEWSEEVFRICGQAPETFQPDLDNVLALIAPEHHGEITDHLKTIGQHGVCSTQFRILLPTGESRQVQVRGQIVASPDGKSERVVGTVLDITEHQEVESLRRSEADLSALIENTDRIVWSVDTELRVVIRNSAFAELSIDLFGYELMPGDSAVMEGETEWRKHYERALAGEKFVIEMQLAGPAGQPRWMDFSFCPIRNSHGRVTGVTVFGRDFTERMATEAAQQQTLDNMSRMVAELEAHHRQNTLLHRLNDLIQSCSNEDEAHVIVRVTLSELFPGISGGLALPRAHGLESAVVWGDEAGLASLFQADDCWALRQGQMIEVVDPANDLVCKHFETIPLHGYLCLPLVVHGDMIGLMHLAYPPKLEQKDRENLRELLRSAGETIKLSLSNLRMREAMREQATHDQLTGLFNRRYQDETLPRELHRALREKQTLTVAMLDIDHFKRFNDSYGHEAGDQVLREIGRVLRENLRRSDIACRYGGEELSVIMPASNTEDARHRLETICQLIRGMAINFHRSMLPPVTVSVGIAQAPDQGQDATELMRAADTALYAAKAAGRDRIEVYAGETN
ncbi:diguanylate cyclase [Denitratisoma oestradiolicum]|uniref:diguanylate cyclase n=1 Tax=Denitratisoma oestradiolicum TaxID=311182 RepID=A0A6S6XXI9_9PROT|nr:diguanylate cyclase [Denitratisoma oestradiolicum]TWO80506.1 hypothetical protein CBW56_08675 [Denitratisoma oestradiolicum]CAB1367572.1 conserved protein of unknown function [Denitratisoma oestradiolicum]